MMSPVVRALNYNLKKASGLACKGDSAIVGRIKGELAQFQDERL